MFKEFPGVNVDTVDGYQGREREIIFFSSVRAHTKGQKAKIGFLSDVRRMNVALTRPRSSLIVVGNSRALKSNPDWRAMVNKAVSTNCCILSLQLRAFVDPPPCRNWPIFVGIYIFIAWPVWSL